MLVQIKYSIYYENNIYFITNKVKDLPATKTDMKIRQDKGNMPYQRVLKVHKNPDIFHL